MATVGEQLRQAREKQKLTIQDVSEKTKIRTDHISALEEGNFDAFSAPVYIRGFVRNYAGILRMNVPDVMAELDLELSDTIKFKEPPRLTNESRGAIDFFLLQLSKINWKVAFPLILLAILFSISLFAYRFYQSHKSENPLQKLGPGLYDVRKKQSGETLPLAPPPANRTNR
jgi:cytoskeletal protein RodZ